MVAEGVLGALLRELELPSGLLSLLFAHARAVLQDADRLGLVTERTLDEILARHTADSLLFALARRPAPGELWIDAGSGAGFPGFVLACAFPESRFWLLEPQQRRAGFLDLQLLNLGLVNAEVRPSRLERIPIGAADVVVARALEQPQKTFPLLTRVVKQGGVVLVAAGGDTPRLAGAETVEVGRRGVDSPGRLFMMTRTDDE
ncbi:MAG: RsmG family class I SAM-dependent methyltransferase [Actinomycetota bacterium]|nr:class I SAM-dependent methyltransferase [Actinomycetota bacterium]